MLFSVFVYEFFADYSLSSNSYMVIFTSFIFIFYEYFPSYLSMEKQFLLVFSSILVLTLIAPGVLYKLIFDLAGEQTSGWIDNEILYYYFLAKPLSLFLMTLGYNVVVDFNTIYFEDLNAGILQQVGIAEGCSGIFSIAIFVSALSSYIIVEYRKFDIITFNLMFYGIIMCYVSNLLRMAVIVLVGHYMGMSAFLWVHKYAGWFIFTLWMFVFWSFASYVLRQNTFNSDFLR